MYSITLKSILNYVQPIKGFVYESVRYSKAAADTIEAAVVPDRVPKLGAAVVASRLPPMTMLPGPASGSCRLCSNLRWS